MKAIPNLKFIMVISNIKLSRFQKKQHRLFINLQSNFLTTFSSLKLKVLTTCSLIDLPRWMRLIRCRKLGRRPIRVLMTHTGRVKKESKFSGRQAITSRLCSYKKQLLKKQQVSTTWNKWILAWMVLIQYQTCQIKRLFKVYKSLIRLKIRWQ